MKLRIAIIAIALTFGAAVVARTITADHHHDGQTIVHHSSQKVVNHSGGLDKCGGHYDRKNGGYHFHQRRPC